MTNNINKVLKVCIGQSQKGEIDVFDLMYETSLSYPELKEILEKLISENELVQTDIKSYGFIGETNRTFEESAKRQPDPPLFGNDENGSGKAASLDERRAYLQQLRQELLERMKREEEERKDAEADCDEEPVTDLSDYVINVFSEKLNPDVFIEPPLHPSWDDRNEFMQYCADHLIILMNSDKQMGRVKAIKKARILLSELQKTRNVKTAEVYEYILYALNYMSSYYYNKIRENLV